MVISITWGVSLVGVLVKLEPYCWGPYIGPPVFWKVPYASDYNADPFPSYFPNLGGGVSANSHMSYSSYYGSKGGHEIRCRDYMMALTRVLM